MPNSLENIIQSLREHPKPFEILPCLQSYIWGRRAPESFILRFLNLPLDSGQLEQTWAEAWFGAHSKYPSLVQGAEGLNLHQLAQGAGPVLLGPGQQEMKLLFKILDAQAPLSIQVHEASGPDSKHECWLLVFDPQQEEKLAELYLGFRPVQDWDESVLPGIKGAYSRLQTRQERARFFREQFARVLRQEALDPHGLKIKAFLNHHLIRREAGNLEWYVNGCKQTGRMKAAYGLNQNRLMLNVPGGTPHALYHGVVFELQEAADKTLRLYDQGRNDPARPLHVDEALPQMNYAPAHPQDFAQLPVKLDPDLENLICSPKYALDEIRLFQSPAEYDISMESSYHLLLVMASQGESQLAYGPGGKIETMVLRQGMMVLVPPAVRTYRLLSSGKLDVIKAYAADIKEVETMSILRGKVAREMNFNA